MKRRTGQAITLAAAVVAVVAARAIARFALRDVPHVMDELAYVLQAKTFATFHLASPVHVPRAAFAVWFVDDRAATFAVFPPGWPAVLAPFVALGIGSWANPLLFGATTFPIAALARRFGGARAGAVAAVVWAVSPQAVLLGASLMSHALVALSSAVALLAAVVVATRAHPVLRGERAEGVGLVWVGGAALGIAVATRPLCAVVVACGVGALLLVSLRARRLRARDVVGFLAPCLLACALLGAYNHALTGDALRFPQTAYFDEHAPPIDDAWYHYHPGCNDLGFGPGHGCDYGIKDATHDLANAASNTGDNLRAWLLLAGGGPLVFVLAGFAFARGRKLHAVALLVPSTAAVGLYALYWYAGTCYGARFYHAALPPLLALGAWGLVRLGRRRPRMAAGLLGLWLAYDAALVMLSSKEVSGGYWGADDRFAALAARKTALPAPPGSDVPALVMVAFRGDGDPARPSYSLTSFLRDTHWRNAVRANSALAANGPTLEGAVVFAKFHPALVPALRERFPDRRLYLYVVNAEDEAGSDELLLFEGSSYAELGQDLPAPADNFDSFVVP